MRFRAQLAVGVGALIAITFLSGVLVIIALHTTHARTSELSRTIVDELAAVQRLRISAEEVISAARGYLLTGSPTFERNLAARERELGRSLQAFRKYATEPLAAAELAVIEQRLTDYSRTLAQIARKRSRGDLRMMEHAYEEQLVPRRRRLDAAIDLLVETERAKLAGVTRQTAQLTRSYAITVLLAWCAGLVISVTLALVVMRKLGSQYRLVQTAEARARRAADARKRLLDIVAHDLLSPLNAIVLGLEVMKLKQPDMPHVTTVSTAAARMQRILNDLLDASRVETSGFQLDRARVRVAPLLAATVDLFEQKARAIDIMVSTRCDDGLEADIDPDRVLQTLANLLGNALKFSKTGDRVTIAAERCGGTVRFSVADTGPGIPREELAVLFDAYRQGARSARRASLGLGLYICKTFVEAHAGRIGVDSVVDRGSTFWFEIPDMESSRA